MAEAHQQVAPVLHALDELGDPIDGADLLQHVQRFFVRAAVLGTPERGDAGRDAGERIGSRRAREADGRGRGVLLVVSVQDEDAVHRLGQDRIRLPVLGRDREAHAQEVLGVGQVVARVHERLAARIFERPGRDGRHLRDHPVRGDHPLLGIIDVRAVMIERRQRANGAHHDRHRVSIPTETLEKAVELLVQHRVVGDVFVELGEFRGLGQFAVQQQVADFQEAGLLGQFVDRVAAVQQHALVAVDEGDLAFAGCGGGEPRVVGEDVGLRIELADIDDRRAVRATLHRELDRFAVDFELRRIAHGTPFAAAR